MSNKETNTRVANAFRAMRAIGIKEDKVKPVLKTLMSLYDKNWALIEAENYRVLADAIIERCEFEVEDYLEVKAQATEQPLKRLRRRPQDGQTSSLNTSNASMPRTPLAGPTKEPEELFEIHLGKLNGCNKGKQPISSNPSLVLHNHESGDPSQNSIHRSQKSAQLSTEYSHMMKLRDRGKSAASLQIPSREKKPVPESSSNELKVEHKSSKKNKAATHALIKPQDEPIVDEMQRLEEIDVTINTVDASRLRSAKFTVPSPPCNDINGGPQLGESHASWKTVISKENQENCAEEMNGQDVVDIAKGHENVIITLVNEFNDEPPPSFYYIPQNTVFQNAYINVSLARTGDDSCCQSCSGDCLSSSIPCACSYETGGEYAYTEDGLVKEELLNESISMNRDPDKHCQFYCKECPLERSKCEDIIEPCQGHLVRRFIKECWRKCGCNKQCGNRVVQRGITRKLQVFMTKKKGWGLRTLEDLPKGAFVCEYVGEVLTNTELFERVLKSPEGEKRSYPVLLDADWCAEGVLKDEEALCLDATYYGNVARFINHKCHDSNLVEIPVEVETPDHHYYHLAFFTTRKVRAMEELTWDYGIDFDDHEHPIKAFHCQCGSKFCRNVKRKSRSGKRW